jgi:hypothetical protein
MTDAMKIEALKQLRRFRGVRNPSAGEVAVAESLLFELKDEDLAVEAPLVAQYRRCENAPLVGIRRWAITDKECATLQDYDTGTRRSPILGSARPAPDRRVTVVARVQAARAVEGDSQAARGRPPHGRSNDGIPQVSLLLH